jgi:tetratricopeptide (TPR) repeat protein
MAWSRAQQAVTLLGRTGALNAVTDEAARRSAYLTLAEVCFVLGVRNTRLPSELGRPDLFVEAHSAAIRASRYSLGALLQKLGHLHRAMAENRLHALVDFANSLPGLKHEVEPWLRLEIASKAQIWAEELEGAVFNGHNAEILVRLLPAFYEALDLPDRESRTQRLLKRAVQMLVKDKQYASALAVLRQLPERQPAVEATCHEGLGDFRKAAESHQLAGNLKDALQCYRSIPDFEAALKLVGEIGNHPAADSLRWISDLQQVVSRRPEKFTKVVTPAEKKLLEEILERSLGVARRKPTPRKTVAKKTAAVRKATPARPF